MGRIRFAVLGAAGLAAFLLGGGSASAAGRGASPRAYAAFCMGVQSARDLRYEDAIHWLERALVLDPQAAEPHVWLGVIYDDLLRPRRPKQAEEHFRRALRLAPGHFAARCGIAKGLARSGQFQKARRELLRAMASPEAKTHRPLAAKVYTQFGLLAEIAGRRDEAVADYRRAAELAPNPAYPLLRLGRLYRDLKRYEEAVRTFERVLRRVPGYAYVLRDLASTYQAMGRWREAAETLLRYADHPQCPENKGRILREAAGIASTHGLPRLARRIHARRLLGLLRRFTPEQAAPHLCDQIASALVILRRFKEAEPYLRKALETTQDRKKSELRRRLAAVLRHLGRRDEAARQLRLAIRAVEPKQSIPLRIELCTALEEAGRFDEAEATLKALLDIPGAQAAGHAQLGLFHERCGRHTQAIDEFRKAVALARNREKAVAYRIHLGLLLSQARRDREAETLLTESVQLFPDSAPINNALGWFYAERGIKLDTALTLVRKALKTNPKNAHYLDSLGWVYFKQGRPKEALELLLRAARLVDNSVILDHLGDVYQALGRPKKACLHWKQSLKLDPDQTSVRRKLEQLKPKH